MSCLEALLVDDEDDSQQRGGEGQSAQPGSQQQPTGGSQQPGQRSEGSSSIAQTLNNLDGVQPSQLGDRMNNFMMKFVQFLELNNAAIGRTGPTPEHIKETAEYGIKDLLSASTDVQAELVRIGTQFQMENPDVATDERIKELDATIAAQEKQIKQVSAALNDLNQRNKGLVEEEMWHEARRQEKKVRSHMVDAAKRNERRKQYYESIRRDPEQFMQIHGRKCQIHLDPAIAQVAESSSTLRKWQGNPTILIDRFDARSHLDFIPEVKRRDDDDWDSPGLDEEEAQCEYERYRVLVANEYKKIGEKQCLKDIATKEFWSEKSNHNHHRAKLEMQKKKQLSEKKAAIGFSYEGSDVVSSNFKAPSGESEHEEEIEELGFDLKLDVRHMGAVELSQLNKIAQQYRVGGTEFIRLIKVDQKDQDEAAQIKEIDKAKLALSGRQARQDRAILKKRRAEIVGKVSQNEEATTTLLSFIAKKKDNRVRRDNSSSSEDDRRVHHEKTEFIRSFGGGRGEKNYDASPTRDVVQGPVLSTQQYRKILALKSKRSPSPSTLFDEPSVSRKISSPVRKKLKSRSRSPTKNGNQEGTVRAGNGNESDYNSAEDAPLVVRSSMSESEKERLEIENQKRRIRRTKRMARKKEKAHDSDSDNDRQSIAARKLRQQMQRALTKTADDLEAEQEEKQRELRDVRRKRDDNVHDEAMRIRERLNKRSRSIPDIAEDRALIQEDAPALARETVAAGDTVVGHEAEVDRVQAPGRDLDLDPDHLGATVGDRDRHLGDDSREGVITVALAVVLIRPLVTEVEETVGGPAQEVKL